LVGSEGDIDKVAQYRHRTQRHVDAEIQEHSGEHDDRGPKPGPGVDPVASQQAPRGVANARNEANQGIPTEPKRRAGNPEASVECSGEGAVPFEMS
jgi:hypothetical protein